jgi:hypothetical protein
MSRAGQGETWGDAIAPLARKLRVAAALPGFDARWNSVGAKAFLQILEAMAHKLDVVAPARIAELEKERDAALTRLAEVEAELAREQQRIRALKPLRKPSPAPSRSFSGSRGSGGRGSEPDGHPVQGRINPDRDPLLRALIDLAGPDRTARNEANHRDPEEQAAQPLGGEDGNPFRQDPEERVLKEEQDHGPAGDPTEPPVRPPHQTETPRSVAMFARAIATTPSAGAPASISASAAPHAKAATYRASGLSRSEAEF